MIESLADIPFRRFVLVRHGEAMNAAGRCVGHSDLPLCGTGIESVQNFARALRARSADEYSPETWQIVSSDLSRARSSAELIAAELGLTPSFDPRLREMHFGEWDGLAWSEIESTDGDRCLAWMEQWTTARPPNGETVNDVIDRASDWLRSTRDVSARVHTLIVVTHAGWIRSALCYLSDTPNERMFDFAADYAHATVVEMRKGAVQVLLMNDCLNE